MAVGEEAIISFPCAALPCLLIPSCGRHTAQHQAAALDTLAFRTTTFLALFITPFFFYITAAQLPRRESVDASRRRCRCAALVLL